MSYCPTPVLTSPVLTSVKKNSVKPATLHTVDEHSSETAEPTSFENIRYTF